MTYQFQNFRLLQEMDLLLKKFPFDSESKRKINKIELSKVYKTYFPNSDVEKDPVANAICWSVSTLERLLDEKPVKCLDEVLSFVENTLKKEIQS